MKHLVCFDGSQVSKDCLKWTIKKAKPAEDTPEKMFFGSTAQFVILEAHRPVLTLK